MELIGNVNKYYKKNIKAFWKFVNWRTKSDARNKIETLTDDSRNIVNLVMQIRSKFYNGMKGK